MGNPDGAATQDLSEGNTSESFADKVAKAVNESKQDEHGVDVLPEDLSEEVQYAAGAELRRRHTQGQYSKSQQTLKAQEAENSELRKLVVPQLSLTVEQAEELEDLKNTDPDAWEKKLNKYRDEARSTTDKDLEKISSTASQAAEVERRAQVLEDFTKENSGFQLNDEVLANDIPPRIKSKLEKGEITFEVFLVEARDFLARDKTVGDANNIDKDPNLNDVGGGSNATDDAVAGDIVKSYESEIY